MIYNEEELLLGFKRSFLNGANNKAGIAHNEYSVKR